ncbi:MAG: glycosyltransferase family 4 protein [Acidobacteriota bacterium]|nr:glycosyltransferase family 4 protein [Acidobacteriota bacterium]
MPKVLHILDSLNRGGAEIMALDLCRNAGASGLDLTFVATGGGDLEDDFRNSGVEFIRLNRRLPVDLSLVSQLRQIIAERKIEIVHSHQPVEALHLYLATRGSEVKRVLTLHGVYAGTKNALALRFVLPRMHARVLLGKELAAWLAEEQGVNVGTDFVVINNGVDPRRLLVTGRSLRTELGLANDAILCGMVANFYPDRRKDQLTVCRALPQLFDFDPRAQFVFVGGSSSAPDLLDECAELCRKNNISNRVHFLGQRSDIPYVLNSLDLFVLSSRWEGSPISAMEAMMLGVPAVLSDIAPLKEVSGDGEFAVLFRTGDADDLASKLIQLVGNREDRAHLAEFGKRWAFEQYSIETHIANLLKLYGALLN